MCVRSLLCPAPAGYSYRQVCLNHIQDPAKNDKLLAAQLAYGERYLTLYLNWIEFYHAQPGDRCVILNTGKTSSLVSIICGSA